MSGETIYKIYCESEDVEVIKNMLHDILTNCPIDLTDTDCMDIMRAIAEGDSSPDVEGIEIVFQED